MKWIDTHPWLCPCGDCTRKRRTERERFREDLRALRRRYTSRWKPAKALVTVALLTLAACGGDDTDIDPAACRGYADLWVECLDTPVLSDEQVATCERDIAVDVYWDDAAACGLAADCARFTDCINERGST